MILAHASGWILEVKGVRGAAVGSLSYCCCPPPQPWMEAAAVLTRSNGNSTSSSPGSGVVLVVGRLAQTHSEWSTKEEPSFSWHTVG